MQSVSQVDPNRVAAYIRWSTDDQAEGTTLEVQRERCRHFMLSQGWSFDEGLVYVDDGYSGGSLDRPALSRLRADVAAGQVRCVVVYRIDRLSRSVVDIVDLVLREWEGRCFVRSASEEINTLTPAGKMFFYLLVSFAEYERNVIRERTMTGKIKRAEQGMNPGFRPPFGYVRGPLPGTFAVREEQAAVVRMIFAWYLSGMGPAEIARTLADEAPGRRWSAQAVRRILANPAYAGVLTYGRRRDGPPLACAEGAFPAIIDRPAWEQAQAVRGRRGPSDGGTVSATGAAPTGGAAAGLPPGGTACRSPSLLAGLARCRCGGAIGGNGAGRHRYYACTRRRRLGKAACDARHISADGIDADIAAQVQAHLTAPQAQALAERLGVRARQAQAAGQRRLAALHQRRRRLAEDYRRGDLPAPLYARELAALEADERRAAAAQEQPAPAPLRPEEMWDRLNVNQRRWLLGQLTRSVTLYRTGDGPAQMQIDWATLL